MTFRYWTTDLLTGTVLEDDIPLNVTSFSRQINTIGQLTATLPLNIANPGQVAAYVAALEPRRTVLWVSQDEAPIWNGIVWDWPHQSMLDGTLPITAASLESLFQHRRINTYMAFSGDVFDTVRALITYATSKTPNGQVAGLQLSSTESGVPFAVSYLATDLATVWDAVTALVTATSFEIALTPALTDSRTPVTVLQLGLPHIGRPVAGGSAAWTFPGNVLDYGFPRTGSTSANSLIATAPPNGSAASWQSQYPHGQDAIDLAAGYPLLEDTVSWSGKGGVTTQAQIDGFADGKLPQHTGAQELPVLYVEPTAPPLLREIQLGDYCNFAASSVLHPANPDGTPGVKTTARIIGWTCTPPGAGQTEQTRILLGGITLP